LFVRQHYVVDIFSAVLLVALAYWVVQKAKWERFFARVNEWWNAKICSFIPSWTTLKTNTKHKISYNSNHTRITLMIIFILCSTLLCGGMLYFGAISCVTGDPFQGLWKFGLDGLWPK
jgi:uncharacterized membrane protein YwzB